MFLHGVDAHFDICETFYIERRKRILLHITKTENCFDVLIGD